jgi:hypothetical protein
MDQYTMAGEFIGFWKIANESTSSSFENVCHFSHYKAISGNPTLV